jgi:cytochrome P450
LQFLTGSAEAFKAKARVLHYVDSFIAEAKMRQSHIEPKPQYDMLKELRKVAPDHSTLRDQVLHILLASRDTVACLLSNLVFVLSKHPVVYSRLRKEVVGCCGSGRPSIEQLHSMKYLKWCVNEC